MVDRDIVDLVQERSCHESANEPSTADEDEPHFSIIVARLIRRYCFVVASSADVPADTVWPSANLIDRAFA
jgi:hypothetical protein